jgi:hypothetical protein
MWVQLEGFPFQADGFWGLDHGMRRKIRALRIIRSYDEASTVKRSMNMTLNHHIGALKYFAY